LSEEVEYAVEVRGERFVDPGALTHSLASAVVAGGGSVVSEARVTGVASRNGSVHLSVEGRGAEQFDAVVIASGAWLADLARPLGVRTAVHGGRGYSFSANAEVQPQRPIYFPEQRVVCTPLGDRVRVSRMMEIQHADARPSARRIQAIADSL